MAPTQSLQKAGCLITVIFCILVGLAILVLKTPNMFTSQTVQPVQSIEQHEQQTAVQNQTTHMQRPSGMPTSEVTTAPTMPSITRITPKQYQIATNGDLEMGFTHCELSADNYVCKGMIKNIGNRSELFSFTNGGYASGDGGDHASFSTFAVECAGCINLQCNPSTRRGSPIHYTIQEHRCEQHKILYSSFLYMGR